MEKELFLCLPRYLKDVTEQVALGGGEPTLYPELVEQFAQEIRLNSSKIYLAPAHA
jgi:pyruvate-formate lyase-activating enzyme